MAEYTATPATWTALQEVQDSDMNAEIRDPFLALSGAWNPWTPTLSQGGASDISKTVSEGGYIRFGKLVIASCALSVTGSGSSGNEIRITLPVTPAYTGSQFHTLGVGIFRNATTEYPGILVYAGSGALAALRRADANSSGEIGTDPSILCNSGDFLSVTAIYQGA